MSMNPRLFLKRVTLQLNSRQPQSMRFFSLFRSGERQPRPEPPELCIERPDGIRISTFVSVCFALDDCMANAGASDEKISKEDDLYRYTRRRWLFDEQSELSKRYSKFNLQQLTDTAVSVIDGARYCAFYRSRVVP